MERERESNKRGSPNRDTNVYACLVPHRYRRRDRGLGTHVNHYKDSAGLTTTRLFSISYEDVRLELANS